MLFFPTTPTIPHPLSIREREREREYEEENYYKPVNVNNFWSNSYIECESNGVRNRKLPVKRCFNKIRPYLKETINDLKTNWHKENSINNSK